VPAVCQFTEDGMAIIIGEPIAHRQGRDGLATMMQDVADFFAETIARQPQDWQMMQPFFSDRKPAEEAQ
jgi:lauroyl/myristoyl acyltransferase